MQLFFGEERAKALARAVCGEALPYEDLNEFKPEKGMILANASAVGMEPHTDQTPICKAFYFSKLFFSLTYIYYFTSYVVTI